MRLLLVEDDDLLGDGLMQALQREGYTVDWVRKGAHAIRALTQARFDLVLLDLGLPDMDGVILLQEVRRRRHDEVVLILSARDQVTERVRGLDAGADDYLIKPFAFDELTARIRSSLRRSHISPNTIVTVGPLEIDTEYFLVRYHGQALDVSRREFAVLSALARQAGKILTRDRLEQEMYGWSDEFGSNTLEVHIHHLRKKLGADMIRTIRGVGYQLNLDVR